MTVSPSEMFAKNDNVGVSAQLVGDFATYQEFQTFSSKYLFIPSYPVDDSMVKAGSKFWQFVDRQLVTLDGSECNKIGTSYTAFRNQQKGCENTAMSCLQNQLLDYHNVHG